MKHAHSCAHDHKPIAGLDLSRASKIARTRAENAGLRWTDQRERALELLLQASGPVKAYDMIAAFQPGANTAPPTVYRALDTLVDLGLAHKIASQNAYVACVREDHDHHAASFLFCDCCGAVEEFDAPIEALAAAASDQKGFLTQAISIEAHGLCKVCRPAGN